MDCPDPYMCFFLQFVTHFPIRISRFSCQVDVLWFLRGKLKNLAIFGNRIAAGFFTEGDSLRSQGPVPFPEAIPPLYAIFRTLADYFLKKAPKWEKSVWSLGNTLLSQRDHSSLQKRDFSQISGSRRSFLALAWLLYFPKNRVFENAEKSLWFLHYFLWTFSKIFILEFFLSLAYCDEILMQ